MINPRSDGGNADVQEKKGGGGRLNAAYMHNPPIQNSKDRKKALRGQVSRDKRSPLSMRRGPSSESSDQ